MLGSRLIYGELVLGLGLQGAVRDCNFPLVDPIFGSLAVWVKPVAGYIF